MDQLLECRLEGVEIVELVTFLERETGKVRLDILNPSWMIFSEGFRQGRVHEHAGARCSTSWRASPCSLLAAPVMLLTALAIKLTEGLARADLLSAGARRPVRPAVQAAQVPQHARGRRARRQAQWAQKNDSRVTRVGAFIRLTRIDELPQILNVLRGEMSFVGPRPERPEFVEQLNETNPVLPRAALDQAGHHRLGAAVLSVRLIRAGRDREAAVRSVLRQESQPALLHRDPGADSRSDRVGQGRAVERARRRTSARTTHEPVDDMNFSRAQSATASPRSAFVLLTVLLVVSWRGRRQGVYLIAASAITARLGAAARRRVATRPHAGARRLRRRDRCATARWLLALASIAGSRAHERCCSLARVACAALLVRAGGRCLALRERGDRHANPVLLLSRAGLLISLLGLVLLEQIYRNSQRGRARRR